MLKLLERSAYMMNADIATGDKGSRLQFHMACPCSILFHGLAILIKWSIILNKRLKLFPVLLLITVLTSDIFISWLKLTQKNVTAHDLQIKRVKRF